MTVTAPPVKASKNALFFILVTVALNSIGFGLIIPIMPEMLSQLSGLSVAEAARWGGYLSVTYAVMNFLVGPTLGNISDRFGRRPVLLTSLAFLMVDYLIMGFATGLGLLFLGRILTGASGATVSTANAYIADVTPAEKRAAAFGMVGAAFGFGFILGPVLGGILGDAFGFRAPFFAAAGVAGLNFLYGYFVLPESLQPENRRAFDMKRANPIGAFASVAKVPMVKWFLLATLFFGFAHFVYPSTWSFFGEVRFNWSSAEIGYSLGAFGVGSIIVQAILIRPIIARFGPEKTAIFGLLLNAIGFILLAYASTGWMVYAIFPLSALGAVFGPAMNQMMSARIPANAQGELQGALSSTNAVANIFSPLLMTQVFAYFSSGAAPIYFPGGAFFLAALLCLATFFPLLLGIARQEPEFS